MISLRFEDFRNDNFEEIEECYEMYVLKDGDKVLYVGISSRGAWNRWFSQWGSHMMRNIYEEWFPRSHVGKFVLVNMPHSLDWTIELWTREDCYRYLGYTDLSDCAKAFVPLERFEAEVIRRMHPSLNIEYNS